MAHTDTFQDFRDDLVKRAAAQKAVEQYRLGRVYYEMSMVDQALAPLEAAACDPGVKFEAAWLLGRIYRETGRMTLAVDWLERAAEAPAPSADEARALLYDLATTLESVGEADRALAIFLELQAESGNYRDVSARVGRLASVQSGD